MVYRCTHNEQENTVSLKKLLYIGEAEQVRERIEGHEKKKEWKSKLLPGEQLCFSFAPVTNPDRERAEAALIFKHKPECNEEFINDFPYEETTVKSSGKCEFIESSFTVQTTTNKK